MKMKLKNILTRWKSACICIVFLFSGSINAQTTLNIVVAYAPGSVPSDTTPVDYVNGLIGLANSQYFKSKIEVEFNPVVIAPVNNGPEFDLSGSNIDVMERYTSSFMDLADLTGVPSASFYINTDETWHVHQVVLLLPQGNPLECGVALAAPGDVGMFSIVRSECRDDNLVLAHELGHNLGAEDSTDLVGQGVVSCWGGGAGEPVENCWSSVMQKGADNRQYFTNPNVYDPDVCGTAFNGGLCGDATHDNALVITNHLQEAVENYCDINLGSSGCVNIEPPDLSINWARYEYGNCVGASRHGTVEWESVGVMALYEVEYRSGTNWYNLYTGANLEASFNTTANPSRHYFKVRAKLGSYNGDWKSFSGYVPNCSAGGGGGRIH